MIQLRSADVLNDLLTNSTIQIVPSVSHWLHLSDPDVILTLLKSLPEAH